MLVCRLNHPKQTPTVVKVWPNKTIPSRTFKTWPNLSKSDPGKAKKKNAVWELKKKWTTQQLISWVIKDSIPLENIQGLLWHERGKGAGSLPFIDQIDGCQHLKCYKTKRWYSISEKEQKHVTKARQSLLKTDLQCLSSDLSPIEAPFI